MNPSFDDYAHYFESTNKQLIPASSGFNSVSVNWLIKLIYHLSFYVGRVIHRLGIKNNVISIIYLNWEENFDLDTDDSLSKPVLQFIQGWPFQAPKLLRNYHAHITAFFRPAASFQTQIDSFFQPLHSRTVVGVHIRHGDYQFFEKGRYFYEISVYERLMLHLAKHSPGISFLVCSNNRSVKSSDFVGLEVTMAPGHELLDLYLLAKCSFILGPPSTYSMWASFYGNVPLCSIANRDQAISFDDFKLIFV